MKLMLPWPLAIQVEFKFCCNFCGALNRIPASANRGGGGRRGGEEDVRSSTNGGGVAAAAFDGDGSVLPPRIVVFVYARDHMVLPHWLLPKSKNNDAEG